MTDRINPPRDVPAQRLDFRGYLARVGVAMAAVAGLWLAWHLRQVLGLVFAAVVAAVVIDTVARPIRRYTGASRNVGSAAALILMLVLLGLAIWAGWPNFSQQFDTLIQQLPTSMQALQEQFGGWLKGPSTALSDAMSQVMSWSMSVIYAITSLILVVLSGVFLAAAPEMYRDGLVRLFPDRSQPDLRRALDRTGEILHLWLLGKVLSMTIIGVGVGLGTWAIGLPAPFALGLFSGLLAFVPIVGPIVGAAPGLILAASMGTGTILWTLALYVGIEQLESNLILPLVEGETAGISPALLIVSFAAFAALLGLLGTIIAAPLAVAVYALVKQLYLHETL